MTALAPSAPRRLVLADRVFPRHLVVDITLVVLGAALVGGLAQLYVPLWPVPITGQTLAVLLVGATLGTVRGALSLTVYAVLGIIGVPWFSEAVERLRRHRRPDRRLHHRLHRRPRPSSAGSPSASGTARSSRRSRPSSAARSSSSRSACRGWRSSLGIGVDLTLEYGLCPFIIGGAHQGAPSPRAPAARSAVVAARTSSRRALTERRARRAQRRLDREADRAHHVAAVVGDLLGTPRRHPDPVDAEALDDPVERLTPSAPRCTSVSGQPAEVRVIG